MENAMDIEVLRARLAVKIAMVELERAQLYQKVQDAEGHRNVDLLLQASEVKCDEMIGDRVDVYWPAEKRTFSGVVQGVVQKIEKKTYYRVKYDDGDCFWEQSIIRLPQMCPRCNKSFRHRGRCQNMLRK